MRGQEDRQNQAGTPGIRSPKSRTGGGRPADAAAARLLALQRTAGNAAVARAVAEERHRHDANCGHGPGPESASVQRSAVHQVLRSSGWPLDTPTRTEMESRLGADFGDVRLHTDAVAQRSAEEIGARAYTSGSHVVVGRDGMDKHTLAHELTHVVQQRRGPVDGRDQGGGLKVSDPGDRFEREAEETARRVMAGAPPVRAGEAGPQAAGGVQRAVDTGPPRVQRAPATATAEDAGPEFRRTTGTAEQDRDVTLRMLDRLSRVARDTIVDTNGEFKKKNVVARSAKKITPHLAVSLLPDGHLAIAGNTGDKKVTDNDKKVVEDELARYVERSDEVTQAKAAERNRNTGDRANKDRTKLRALVEGSYIGGHGGNEGLLAVSRALEEGKIRWYAVGGESAKQTSQHGEMTVLGEHVAEWVRNPRTGESPKTVMMGGVKLACAGCEWAFEAVNAHIGRPNGYQIEAAGAHGQFFPGWVMPEWMRQYPDVVEAVRARAEAEGKTLENYVLKGTMSDRTVGHDPDESASEWEETR
ncbi:DUF4157 domain-containing protein [Streptomyces sp. NPDC086843]|uniref:eCIS core domain-containing protein n=1 Tax=Streptomyces sp. NPDC086843 TaxID=3365763 RepID=UPI0037F3AB38